MQIFISRMLLSYFLKKNTLFFKNTKLDECLPGILIESNKKFNQGLSEALVNYQFC